jgi:hypothetical protein
MVLVITLVAILAAVVIPRWWPRESDHVPHQLVAELADLRAENGLFLRPGLSEAGEPAWNPTAYALTALRALGVAVSPADDARAAQKRMVQEIDEDSLWGHWHVSQVAMARGEPAPVPGSGLWRRAITGDSDDVQAQAGVVAAVVDIAQAAGVPVPVQYREEMAARLAASVEVSQSPYLLARAWLTFDALGEATAPLAKHLESIRVPGDLTGPESLMDVWGVLKLAEHAEYPLSSTKRASLKALIAPLAAADPWGSELKFHYAVKAWLLLEGDPTAFAAAANELARRVDPGTGLLHQRTGRIGTVQNTYQVSRMLGEHFPRVIDDDTVLALADALERAEVSGDDIAGLQALVSLSRAGHPDTAAEQRVVRRVTERLQDEIPAAELTVALDVVLMVTELSAEVPPLRAEEFVVADEEARLLAWRLLGNAHFLADRDEVIARYDAALGEIPDVLVRPELYQSAEVIAALFAAESVGGVGEIDYDGLRGWATSSQGCKGFRQLHRPVLDTDICTLRVTADFVAAGLWEEA